MNKRDQKAQLKRDFEEGFSLTNVNLYFPVADRDRGWTILSYAINSIAASLYHTLGFDNSLSASNHTFGKADVVVNVGGKRFSIWRVTDKVMYVVSTRGAEFVCAHFADTSDFEAHMRKVYDWLPQPTTEPYFFLGNEVGTSAAKLPFEAMVATVNQIWGRK
jgi:hypothetical protein